MMRETRGRSEKTLWIGAIATAIAAVLFPRLEAVKNEDVAIWDLDSEAVILAPLIVVVTLGLFGLVGRWAWHDDKGTNRPARVAVVAAPLGLVGVLAFFLSAPIILGGFGITLGVEGRRRAEAEGKRTRATIGVVVGAIAFVIGAATWLLA